jgi:hypothetical protein
MQDELQRLHISLKVIEFHLKHLKGLGAVLMCFLFQTLLLLPAQE